MEKAETMSPQDIKALKYERRIGFVFSGLIICFGALMTLAYPLIYNGEQLAIRLVAMLSSTALLSVMVYFWINYNVLRDLRSNKKLLAVECLQDKQQEVSYEAGSGAMYIPILGNLFPKLWGQKMRPSNKYYFVINHVRYEVDEVIFNKVKVGDRVERHFTQHSQTILGFAQA